MDAADLLRSADARVRLDLISPPAPRVAGATLRAPPGRLDATLAAAALGYLLRFEIERRHPGTARAPWLVEAAPERLTLLAPEMVDEAGARIGAAKHELARYVNDAEPSPRTRMMMASHALRLGRLESAVRVGYVDEGIRETEDDEDVADLLAMFDALPWDALGAGTHELGEELVVGGTLLAIKATKTARIDVEDVRALLLRYLLLRAADPGAAARVERIGILLARHGHLWSAPVAAMQAHEAFAMVEAWLAERLRTAQPADAERRRGTPSWVKRRFPPKAPMTHPEGKAEKKKSTGGARAAAPDAARKASAPRKEADEHERPDGAAERRRTSKPDWRKGSVWRRERGL